MGARCLVRLCGAAASELGLKDGGELDRKNRELGSFGRGNLMNKGLEMRTDEGRDRDGERKRNLRL